MGGAKTESKKKPPRSYRGGLLVFNQKREQVRHASSQARSKRSASITLVQAATKSLTNFSFESAHA